MKNSFNQFYLRFFCLITLCYLITPSSGFALTIQGTIQESQQWTYGDSPVEITGAVLIPEDVSVSVESGVQVKIAPGAVMTVKGKFDAIGIPEEPISFSPSGSSRWGSISYEETGTGTLMHCLFHRGSYAAGDRHGVVNSYRNTAPVIIDSCTFTEWPDEFDAKATNGFNATNMTVRHCYFGEGVSEAVYGVNCPALVEYNTFAPRHEYRDAIDIGYTQNPGPIIRYNVFLGSDDDAIDLDTCDAYVEGNLVMNCRGGNHDPIGISGDKDARPIIVNNVIINCESGIGFKNGADITVLNNTIINCDKGIWMHQNPAHAYVKNTIIWGKEDQVSIKLEPGSTIDISYSIIRGDEVYPGEGNLNADPLFADLANNDFHLLPGSPAIDAGWLGALVLNHDFDGNLRVNILHNPNAGEGAPSIVDIGAFEFIPEITGIKTWRLFEQVSLLR